MQKDKNSFLSFSNVAIGILLFVILYQAHNGTVLRSKVQSLNNLTVDLIKEAQTPKIEYYERKVYVTEVPQVNSSHKVADSPCLQLQGVETFIDQWGTKNTVDWNVVKFMNTTAEYVFQDNTGIATCYDAYITINGSNYHVNRSRRFSKLT